MWGTGYIVLTQPCAGLPEGESVTVTATHPSLLSLDGMAVTGVGSWGVWGGKPQFQFQNLQPRDGDLDLLAHVLGKNLLPGIGPAKARKIVDKWGADFPRHMNVQDLMEAKIGIGYEAACEIAAEWPSKEPQFVILLGAIKLGLTALQAMRAEKELGENFLILAQQNPWILCEVPGIGLVTADAVARQMGKPFDCPERTGAILHDVITEHMANGHTWMSEDEALRITTRRAEINVRPHWQEVTERARRIVKFKTPDGSQSVLATFAIHEDEVFIANWMVAQMERAQPVTLPHPETMTELSAEQQAAVIKLLSHPVSVLTGGPGTGKTTTLRTVVSFLDRRFQKVVLCAPTGKAANRMAGATGHSAQTIHALLHEIGDGHVACNTLIVDEMSMVGIPLMARLLRHVSENTRLIMVGDAFQLPPIEPGQVFRDIIRAGVPTAKLTQIFRTDSTVINEAVRCVRERKPFSPDGRQFRIVEIPTEPDDDWMAEQVASWFDTGILPEDTVVIAAFRSTIDALNKRLQLRNPNLPLQIGNLRVAVGDPVRHIKNNYELDVFNGETGRIVSIDPTAMDDVYAGNVVIEVDYGDRVVSYKPEHVEELKLAYAITIHASQGSEWPSVLVIYPYRENARLKQSWLALEMVHTAVSRAQNQLVIAVDPKTALPFYLRPVKEGGAKDLNYRNTLLKELLDVNLRTNTLGGDGNGDRRNVVA